MCARMGVLYIIKNGPSSDRLPLFSVDPSYSDEIGRRVFCSTVGFGGGEFPTCFIKFIVRQKLVHNICACVYVCIVKKYR